jgi:hypothetical protein
MSHFQNAKELAKILVFRIITDEISTFRYLLYNTHYDFLVRFDLFEWLGFTNKSKSIVHNINQTVNALVAGFLS